MKKAGKAIMWAFLFSCALLLVLSVWATFMGAEDAREFFTSPPLVAFWSVFTALTAAGFVFFKGLLRRPDMLAMHLGILLILLGSMLGSDKTHELRNAWFGREKIPSGYMALFEGDELNTVTASDMQTELGKLPFSVRLDSFRVEHYEAEETAWPLWVEYPRRNGGHEHDRPTESIPLDWEVGGEHIIPGTGAVVAVLDYLENASAAEEGGEELHIISRSGRHFPVSAREGARVLLDDPEVEVVIESVYSNLRVRGEGEDREVFEAPGPEQNPAVRIELQWPDGTTQQRYIMAASSHGDTVAGIHLQYATAQAASAEPDDESDRPAMKIQIRYGGQVGESWLIPPEGESHAGLAVDLPGPGGGVGDVQRINFYLVEPQGPVKAYKSDVVVIDDGQAVGRKTIEVNDPLYYEGYHLYQHSYDARNHLYTVLQVKSADGLFLAYAGFFLLCASVFWWGLAVPAIRYIKALRKANN